jgi:hypothetical protein
MKLREMFEGAAVSLIKHGIGDLLGSGEKAIAKNAEKEQAVQQSVLYLDVLILRIKDIKPHGRWQASCRTGM